MKILDQVKGILYDRAAPLFASFCVNQAGLARPGSPSLKPIDNDCSLWILQYGPRMISISKDGQAIDLSPAKDYSVNLEMACPKVEALTPLRAKDRAVYPIVRDEKGNMRRVDWSWQGRRSCDARVFSSRTGVSRFHLRVRFLRRRWRPWVSAKIGTDGCMVMAIRANVMATAVVSYKQLFQASMRLRTPTKTFRNQT